ncbi:uncharacterized protein LOC108904206 isoform X1 [Anoplophora glabripennis]|uniref:uncharacterized protein LOC108904206 isoform X1 n=1 Tax=Anoplophora glabripennis TaxID=217634 RepID=UPI000874A0D4|nr:uncharacterized protein LOC108904206 isoform X1 [Anoplophora glabripennis]
MSRRLSYAYQINKFIQRFPDLCVDGPVIKCRVCEINLLGWSAYQCKRHVESQTHKKNRLLQLPYWVFLYDLIFMFSVCNIPLCVVDNEQFRLFWQKYVPKWPLPQSRRLYRHLQRVKEETENNMLSDLRGKKLWVTVDEIADRKNNKIGHVLARILTPEKANKPYLLASKRLPKNNAESIQQLVTQALEKFCIEKNNVLMLVTGGAAYMAKAAVLLKNVYPNLLHVTCMLQVLHCVAEVIRNNYQAVDNLISSTAKIFLKSPQRIKEFHKSCPGISEPPQPISTRSGTWLKACFYYSKYFHDVKSVIFKFDPSKSHAIRECQQMYEDPEVVENLHTIQDKYSILRNVIDQLEDGSIPLDQSFQIVDNVNTVLQNLTDVPGTEATSKFNDLLQKNLDLPKLGNILQSLHEGNAANDLDQYFKYANITSLDVERSFSKYVALFADKRMCLKEATTEAILMIQTYAMVHHSRATK